MERVSIVGYEWSCPKCGHDNNSEASPIVSCLECDEKFKAD